MFVSSVTILSKENQRLLHWERAAKISPGLKRQQPLKETSDAIAGIFFQILF
ncbi:MAG: hypothetical protein QNJ70_30835 [Xenococcaceae cyanobacterium MO_207.B15]|nr:hypothetical protein [Xenococcaceae cyanobacterium MO_207.B15]MDJ0747570.1 hypothetical protein [Xenococcaceae cyanobacterium MO_167.B27]